MDPLTALGLATSIFHFVEIARNITFLAKAISKSATGSTKDVDQFRSLANSVRRNMDPLINPTDGAELNEDLQQDAKRLQEYVDECLGELDSLKAKGSRSWYQSLKVAFKYWRMKDRLEEGARKIDQIGNKITLHIVSVHLPQMDRKLDNLHGQTTQLELKVLQEMKNFEGLIKRQVAKTGKWNDDLLEAMDKWFRDEKDIEIQRGCLRALYFPELKSRWERVSAAHEKTFKWILDEDSDQGFNTPHDLRFQRWLQSDDPQKNIFWVSGKAGAGKSTLMKFLSQSDLLRKHIHSWAAAEELIIVDYFFWKLGTSLEKSVKGLLRSLLYQILTKRKTLVTYAFEDQEWTINNPRFQFSQDVLLMALKRLLRPECKLDMRILFLIDGLDEFGEYGQDSSPQDELEAFNECEDGSFKTTELIEFLHIFRNVPSVKLCVSSRPWPDFQQEYGGDLERFFALQDLTWSDIRNYLCERLEKNKIFQSFVHQNKEYMELIEEIINTAQGVFLWVHLASLSLLSGLTNRDRIEDLRHRLRQLPADLRLLYAHMIFTIPLIYRKSAIQMLLITAHAYETGRNSLSPLGYRFLDDNEFIATMEKKSSDIEELLRTSIIIPERINARCQGLLEIGTEPNFLDNCGLSEKHHQVIRLFCGNIVFTHRTAFEFLRLP